MKARPCVITVWPSGRELSATAGDSLYTLLLVAGVIDRNDPFSNRLRLERGTVSPSTDPAAEARAFTPSQQTEGWILASCRRIEGDAELMLGSSVDATLQRPLGQGYGLIIFVGTATICCGLVGLNAMEIPMLNACSNSQLKLASEVTERIRFYQSDDNNAIKMAAFLRNDIARMTERLVYYTGIDPTLITTVTMVGRPPLLKMLLRQDPLSPEERGKFQHYLAQDMQLQLLRPQTDLYLLPAAGPDMGSDTVSAVLAAGLLERIDDEQVSLLIDMGISCEVVAVGRGRIICCSVPTAPLEGEGISCGMQATSGAVYSVEINETVTLHTVHDEAARGLCGAGLISAIYQLAEQDVINEDGRLHLPEDLPAELADRFRGTVAGLEFILERAGQNALRDVCINQEDVRKLQLAKGAVRAACQALLAELGAETEDVASILIAEAYRADISIDAVLGLGMVPPVPKERVRSIGNADWQGAYLVMTDRDNVERAEQISKLLTRIDLSANHVYAAEFIKAMNF